MKWPSHHVNAIWNQKVITVWNSNRCEFSHVNTPSEIYSRGMSNSCIFSRAFNMHFCLQRLYSFWLAPRIWTSGCTSFLSMCRDIHTGSSLCTQTNPNKSGKSDWLRNKKQLRHLDQKLASTFRPFSGLVGRKLSHSDPFADVSFVKAKSCQHRQ